MARMTEPVLTPHEVAAELRCNYETVLRHIKARRLRGVKRGGRIYIRRSAVDAFLADDSATSGAVA